MKPKTKILIPIIVIPTSLFDDETEKILHHDYFLKSRKSKKIKWIKEKLKKIWNWIMKPIPDSFFIHKISPKYVKKGEKVWLFGGGFEDKSIKYSLKIGTDILVSEVKGNELIEITIPSLINEGAYDITAQFKIDEKEGNEPMGIVVHVVDQKYLDQRKSLPKPYSVANNEIEQSSKK